MADGFTDDDSQETGGSLRTKLEAALAESKTLKDELGAMKAEKLIRDKGFSLVEADDLKGVDADKLEAKAAEVQAQKAEAQRVLIRDVLGRRHGVEGDELERLVDEYVGEGPAADTDVDRFRASTSVAGKPAPKVNVDKLDPFEKIKYAVDNPRKRS